MESITNQPITEQVVEQVVVDNKQIITSIDLLKQLSVLRSDHSKALKQLKVTHKSEEEKLFKEHKSEEDKLLKDHKSEEDLLMKLIHKTSNDEIKARDVLLKKAQHIKKKGSFPKGETPVQVQPWNDFVKSVHDEMKLTDPDATYTQAMTEASKRKAAESNSAEALALKEAKDAEREIRERRQSQSTIARAVTVTQRLE